MPKNWPKVEEITSGSDWSILAPKNDAVKEISSKLLQEIPTEAQLYKSTNTVPDTLIKIFI